MNKMVSITEGEYNRLIAAAEDLEDIQALQDHLAKVASGEEETISSGFVKRATQGESLLRLWREHRELSQVELSKRSNVNRVQIGDIEERGKTGSVATLQKLASSLDVMVDDLL